jgi:hypothetical protein
VEKVRIKQATKQGFIECVVGGAVDLSYPNSKTRRGRVGVVVYKKAERFARQLQHRILVSAL